MHYAVDFDGTLVEYDKWVGPTHIGKPIEPMMERVRGWLSEGHKVSIFTARVCHLFMHGASPKLKADAELARTAIHDFCLEHFGQLLYVTAIKDFSMHEFWDDKNVSVEFNTGRVTTVALAENLPLHRWECEKCLQQWDLHEGEYPYNRTPTIVIENVSCMPFHNFRYVGQIVEARQL